MDSTFPIPTPPPPATTCWSNLLKQNTTQETRLQQSSSPFQLVSDCKSSKGIAMAVLDANAIIHGGEKLANCADKFVSLSEVLDEVRDPTSRHRLSFFPFDIQTMEPSPEALKKVISFARATGDLQTLSDIDLKLIALTYTLEAQIHGTKHIRDTPPPVHTLNVRRLPEKDMPGWGTNVPNLEEWEALEGKSDNGSNQNSRIMPLKDLSLNMPSGDNVSLQDGLVGVVDEDHAVDNSGQHQSSSGHRRYPPKKREVKIEGKMVVSGINASGGENEDNGDDWHPAVSRSTHRRYLRRKSRREMYEASLKDSEQQDVEENTESKVTECEGKPSDSEEHASEDKHYADRTTDGHLEISSILRELRLEEDTLKTEELKDEQNSNHADADFTMNTNSDNEEELIDEQCENDMDSNRLEHFGNLTETNESVDNSIMDDGSSEQSWALRTLSESSVACVTGDYAMQNVILQMGLRLLAPGGMQIRELHRWILKCHACRKVTPEIGRIFCPHCGNGGTLRKVAVTVGENGLVISARRPRISLRGTRFSLPLPQGGRNAITKNPVLREDQLPKKFLYGRKKKDNKDEDIFTSDFVFSSRPDKNAPLKPPVRESLAVFSQKRNPNDNHYSRSRKH